MTSTRDALMKAVVEKARIDARLKAWRLVSLAIRQIHIEYVNEDAAIADWCEKSIYAATRRMRDLIVSQEITNESVAMLERACTKEDRDTPLSTLYIRDYHAE